MHYLTNALSHINALSHKCIISHKCILSQMPSLTNALSHINPLSHKNVLFHINALSHIFIIYLKIVYLAVTFVFCHIASYVSYMPSHCLLYNTYSSISKPSILRADASAMVPLSPITFISRLLKRMVQALKRKYQENHSSN